MAYCHPTINSDIHWEYTNGFFTYPHTRLRNTFMDDYQHPQLIPINLGFMVAKLGVPTEVTVPLGKDHFDNYQLGILLLQIYKVDNVHSPDISPSKTFEHLFYECDEQSPDLEHVAMAILGKITDSRVFPGGIKVTDRIRRLLLSFIGWVCTRSVVLARLKNRHVDFLGRINVLDKPIFSTKFHFMQEFYRSLVRDVISKNRTNNAIGWLSPEQYEEAKEKLKVRKYGI